MKKDHVQQEILLVTATTFSNRELSQKDASDKQLSLTAQMEEACWNGLLEELIPEIMAKSGTGKKLYLWNIQPGKHLLQINRAEFPQMPEKHFSIDPCLILLTRCEN